MNHKKKAYLLSALILPGMGHFLIKKPVTGTLLALASILFLYMWSGTGLENAEQLTTQLINGEQPLDVDTIRENFQNQLKGEGDKGVNVPLIGYGLCWFTALFDLWKNLRLQK